MKTIPATMTLLTDANGDFTLEGLAPIPYEVIAERWGFTGASVKVIVSAGRTAVAQLQLAAVDSGALRAAIPRFIEELPASGALPMAPGPESDPCRSSPACMAAQPTWSLGLATERMRLTGLASVDDSHAWA